MKQYIIVHDTPQYKDCLFKVTGSYENSERILNKILSNPREYGAKDNYYNFRIVAENPEPWYNDAFLIR